MDPMIKMVLENVHIQEISTTEHLGVSKNKGTPKMDGL